MAPGTAASMTQQLCIVDASQATDVQLQVALRAASDQGFQAARLPADGGTARLNVAFAKAEETKQVRADPHGNIEVAESAEKGVETASPQ